MPAVTGCMWLFRTTGQVVGVAMTSAILQGTLGHELSEKLTGKGSAKVRLSMHIRGPRTLGTDL